MDTGALHARFGNPTFFITMTGNHMWPEIQFMLHKKFDAPEP